MAFIENAYNAYRALRGAPVQKRARGSTSSLTGGGVVNLGSGLGTSLDNSEGTYFRPTRYYWRGPLEILGVQSAAARNAIDIPIEDALRRWRHFPDVEESVLEDLQKAERELRAKFAFTEMWKAADQFGSGVIVVMSKEDDPEAPLELRRIREGDVTALQWFDRYDLSVFQREMDFSSPNWRQPVYYEVHPMGRGGEALRVHHTRVLRVDGITQPTKSGFQFYDYDFGVSALVPIIVSLLEDQTLAQNVAHLSQEASTKVLHIAGLREAIAGAGNDDEASPHQIGAEINMMQSIYRLTMLDEPGREEFTRVAVAFGGLADLMDKFPARVAAFRRIPYTRFWASPPQGMNATGISDDKNYQSTIESMREHKLSKAMDMWTEILARHVGLREAPKWEWPAMFEDTPKEEAEAAKVKAEAVKVALDAMVLDEDEAREILNGDAVFGELPGPAPEPDPEDILADMPNMPAPQPAGANGNGSNGNGRPTRSRA